MQLTVRHSKIMASGDGTGIVSQAGGLLLTRTLRVTGPDRGLEAALERWRPARAAHVPGKIITDLAVAVALGGDCLADVAVPGRNRNSSGRWPRIRWSPGWWPAWPRRPRER
jgi:hypothetical protein